MYDAIIDFPDFLKFNDTVAGTIDNFVDWINATFSWFFDFIRFLIVALFNGVGFVLEMIPWWLYVLVVFYVAWRLYKSLGTGILLGALVALIGVFGLWDEMIYTLAIILISVFISFILGLPTGILMAKFKSFASVLKPILDMMQTLPSFVYLIPALMLLGIGRVPAVFATTIYAVPPLIRLTFLGISNVQEEVREAGQAFGSTPLQLLFKIELPQALSTIAAGVNQTTMMAVAMVVISSMIGAQGLGREVLVAIRQIEVGDGFVAGLAVVFLAIVLDRLLQGLANKFDQTEGLDG
ncbi:MAG: ABC transporter permease [Candidatus Izemoplasmataceae bacterium]